MNKDGKKNQVNGPMVFFLIVGSISLLVWIAVWLTPKNIFSPSTQQASEIRPEEAQPYDPNATPASTTPIEPPTKLIGFDTDSPRAATTPVVLKKGLPASCKGKSECVLTLDNSWWEICKIGDPSRILFEVWPIESAQGSCVQERVFREDGDQPFEKTVCLGKVSDMARDVGGSVTCIQLQAGTTSQATIKLKAGRSY